MSLIKLVKIRGPNGLPYLFELTAKNGLIIQAYAWAFTTNIFNAATNVSTEEYISVISVISQPGVDIFNLEWLPHIWIDGNPLILNFVPLSYQLTPPIQLNPAYNEDVMFVMPLNRTAQASGVEYAANNLIIKASPMNINPLCTEIPIVANQLVSDYDSFCVLPTLTYEINSSQSHIDVLGNEVQYYSDSNCQPNIECVERPPDAEGMEEHADNRKRSLPTIEHGADMASDSNMASAHLAEPMLKRMKGYQGTEVPDEIETPEIQYAMKEIPQPVASEEMPRDEFANQDSIPDVPTSEDSSETDESSIGDYLSEIESDCTDSNQSSDNSNSNDQAKTSTSSAASNEDLMKLMIQRKHYRSVKTQCTTAPTVQLVKIRCKKCSNRKETSDETNSRPGTAHNANDQALMATVEAAGGGTVEGEMVLRDSDGSLQRIATHFCDEDLNYVSEIIEVASPPELTVEIDSEQRTKWMIVKENGGAPVKCWNRRTQHSDQYSDSDDSEESTYEVRVLDSTDIAI